MGDACPQAGVMGVSEIPGGCRTGLRESRRRSAYVAAKTSPWRARCGLPSPNTRRPIPCCARMPSHRLRRSRHPARCAGCDDGDRQWIRSRSSRPVASDKQLRSYVRGKLPEAHPSSRVIRNFLARKPGSCQGGARLYERRNWHDRPQTFGRERHRGAVRGFCRSVAQHGDSRKLKWNGE